MTKTVPKNALAGNENFQPVACVQPGEISQGQADPLPEQMDLFQAQRWPKRPYCSTDKTAGRIRGLMTAARYPYIQPNPPHLRIWMPFDIDREGGGLAWEPANLLPPAWSSVNRDNGHAHLVWGLSVPVLIEAYAGRRGPLRYLAGVESAMRAMLGADPGYAGLLTKNPAHPAWRTWRGPRQSYDLDEIGQYLSDYLPKHLPRPGVRPELIGLGRNCDVFERLRQWAYVAVRKYRGGGRRGRDLERWQEEVLARALNYNADFPVPLHFNEVKHIARSVSKWVWARDAEAAQKFVSRQAFRGKRGGIASGKTRAAASEDKRASARLMAAAGRTQVQIAVDLGVSQSSISGWLKNINEA